MSYRLEHVCELRHTRSFAPDRSVPQFEPNLHCRHSRGKKAADYKGMLLTVSNMLNVRCAALLSSYLPAKQILQVVDLADYPELDVSFPHTAHCLADGNIMISTLGNRKGNAAGTTNSNRTLAFSQYALMRTMLCAMLR